MLDIQYNGKRGSELKVYAKELPDMPAAKRAYEEIVVSGRNGVYLRDLGRYETTELPIDMNYIGSPQMWHERWRKIQEWLSETNGELVLSDDPDYYLKVTRVNLSNNVHRGKRIGDFTATFVLKDGLYYLRTGKEKYDITDVLWNPGEQCCPNYYISGVGTCVISINNRIFEVTINGSVIIDSERQLIYSEDKQVINNIAKGDYKNLLLEKGENLISISEGFGIKVVPNWRCR